MFTDQVQEEKERAAELLNKERAQLDADKKKMEEEFNTRAAKVQAQHTIEMEGVQRDHDNTLRDLKLRIQVEKEQWLENQKQKQVRFNVFLRDCWSANLNEIVVNYCLSTVTHLFQTSYNSSVAHFCFLFQLKYTSSSGDC